MDILEKCPQCAGTLLNGASRLVQDACGHKKCRLCLLNDEDYCKQCALASAQIDCHTAVITYQKKSDKSEIPNAKPYLPNKIALDVNAIKKEQSEIPPPDVPEVSPKIDKGHKLKQGTLGTMGTKSRVSVARHISFDLEHQLYTCNICNKSFTGKSRVKYHTYCNGEKRPFVCDICNQGFIAKSHYTTHLFTHQKLKPYKCPASGCGKTFSERSKLNRHRSTHGTNRPFVCQECGKSFKINENLRTHSLIHKTEKPYACTECHLRFSHSSNLKKHLAVHTSEKAHMCDQCGKRYKLKWALTLHRRVHAKTRPNKCSTCHKAFVHLKDLARHELIHAESKGFRCGICGSTFRRKDNLNRHARNTHPGKKPQIIKCVDTPNAIKVITSPPPTPTPTLRIKTEAAASPVATVTCNEAPHAVNEEPTQIQPNPSNTHVPVKLAFKTLSFRSHYNINNHNVEPKPEHVSIYEKILKPRSETLRSSTTLTTNIPTKSKEFTNTSASGATTCVYEQTILTPFNAPSHYETSFDNKKHAVIKNIKFKLPDKYTNLNTSRHGDKAMIDNINNVGSIASTTSVIVNSAGTQQTV